MGCGASATNKQCSSECADVKKPAENETPAENDVKPVQGTKTDQIVQGNPVAAEAEETARKLRIIEGLSNAAAGIADAKPSASAGLAEAAAAIAEQLPASAAESNPAVASALAKVKGAPADSKPSAAPAVIQTVGPSANDAAPA